MQTPEINKLIYTIGSRFRQLLAILRGESIHYKRTRKKFKAQMNVLEKKASNSMHRLASRTVAAMDMPKTVTTLTVNP